MTTLVIGRHDYGERKSNEAHSDQDAPIAKRHVLERVESGILNRPLETNSKLCELPPGVNDLDPDWRVEALDEQLLKGKRRFRLFVAASLTCAVLIAVFDRFM